MADLIRVDRHDHHVYAILDRPPANAIDLELLEQLERAFSDIEADETCRLVVWCSARDKFFSGGADIRLLQKLTATEMAAFCNRVRALHLSFRQSAKLHVAAIAGHCLGGGLELALACDLRLARKGNYQIGLPEARLGLMPGGGGMRLALDVIGQHRAFRLAALAETLTVDEALHWGLLDEVFDEANFAERLDERASLWASGAPRAIACMKRLSLEGSQLPIDSAFSAEAVAMRGLSETEDSAEGLSAFTDKRSAVFKGR